MLSVLLGSLFWAQVSSPNSYIALTVGAAAPTGTSQAKSLLYPTHGYALTGANLGLQLQTFVAPYLGLSLRISQSFLGLDAKALGKDDRLFPEPVQIAKNPTVSHTLIGFGVGTGVQLDWIALYVPFQFALGIYSGPEIQGVKSATQTWIQPKFSTAQLGFSTGLITNFPITDDFFVGLSLLFTSVRSGEVEFQRTRYNRGTPDQQFFYRAPVRTDLGEVGVCLGMFF